MVQYIPVIGSGKKSLLNTVDLTKNTFKEIWESKRRLEIVRRVSSEQFDLSKCGLCRQNNINKFLWELSNPPEHINFI